VEGIFMIVSQRIQFNRRRQEQRKRETGIESHSEEGSREAFMFILREGRT